ncbi:MAG: YidC/Oxa1 family membrane protein insertase [Candidatus Magasanikbacteria bacterium]|nr:YidC/Oxa1 family membrane protein insertase [Candidatus Magasanikbacteria bacterium]
MIELWNELLYRPLFNILVWLYNNWAEQNLGWAVVYLTLMLRVLLLPFTFITERNAIKNRTLVAELRRIDKSYQGDPILKKEEIRKTLRKRKVRPWSSAFELGIQLLVLILLYQVFLQGISGEKVKVLKSLYYWVDFPGLINTIFYGFDLAAKYDWLWAGMVAFFFAAYIYREYRHARRVLHKSDLLYFIFFPTGIFLTLWYLPMVKSLFVLTSLLFSAIVHRLIRVFLKPPKKI